MKKYLNKTPYLYVMETTRHQRVKMHCAKSRKTMIQFFDEAVDEKIKKESR